MCKQLAVGLGVGLLVLVAARAVAEPPYQTAWVRQLGTSSEDASSAVSADGLGNVYLSGLTKGRLGGPNAGESDAFLGKYDAAGNLLWTRQLGTSSWDTCYGVSADGLGNVYLSGLHRRQPRRGQRGRQGCLPGQVRRGGQPPLDPTARHDI